MWPVMLFNLCVGLALAAWLLRRTRRFERFADALMERMDRAHDENMRRYDDARDEIRDSMRAQVDAAIATFRTDFPTLPKKRSLELQAKTRDSERTFASNDGFTPRGPRSPRQALTYSELNGVGPSRLGAYAVKYHPEARAQHDDTKKFGNAFYEEGEAWLRGLAKNAADRKSPPHGFHALDSSKTGLGAVQDPLNLWGVARRFLKFLRLKPEPDPIMVVPLFFVRDGRVRAIAVLIYRIDHDQRLFVVIEYRFFLIEPDH